MSEQTRGLKGLPYVDAARALGASGTETLARHILRQFTPMLGMMLAFEAGSTLMVLAALGFLGYYLGGAFWVEVTDFSSRAISGLPELGQMLANSWQIFKPWATVATGTVIFLAILGFNLIGEGMRRRLSTAELGRRTAFSGLTRRVSGWLDEALLAPAAACRRRWVGVVGVVLVVAVVMAVWQPWRGLHGSSEGLVTTPPAVPIPGGHLWVSERRDASGTLASPVSELPQAKVRWILPDSSGFSGGPVVDAKGNIYVASNAGTVYALAPAGEVLWQAELPAEPVGTPALGLPSSSRPPRRRHALSDRQGRWPFRLHAERRFPVAYQDEDWAAG